MYSFEVNADITVKIPTIGQIVRYKDETYVILSTVTHQEQPNKTDNPWIPDFTTFARILRVDDEGNDLGYDAKSVYSDELEEI